MPRFKDPRAAEAYEKARTMHDILAREGSGRGLAYRRGWNGQPSGGNWASYPVYAAGRDNRKKMGGADLPAVTGRETGTPGITTEEREMTARIKDLMRNMLAQVDRATADNHAANPEKHKRSRLFPNGLRYRYFETKRPRRPTIRWCYTSTKNAAGYYLCFRQTVTAKVIKTDEVSAFKRKKDAIETARFHDAKLRAAR